MDILMHGPQQHLPSAFRREKEKSFVVFLLPVWNWFPQNNGEISGVHDLLQLKNFWWLERRTDGVKEEGGKSSKAALTMVEISTPNTAEVITHLWWEIHLAAPPPPLPSKKCSFWRLEYGSLKFKQFWKRCLLWIYVLVMVAFSSSGWVSSRSGSSGISLVSDGTDKALCVVAAWQDSSSLWSPVFLKCRRLHVFETSVLCQIGFKSVNDFRCPWWWGGDPRRAQTNPVSGWCFTGGGECEDWCTWLAVDSFLFFPFFIFIVCCLYIPCMFCFKFIFKFSNVYLPILVVEALVCAVPDGVRTSAHPNHFL